MAEKTLKQLLVDEKRNQAKIVKLTAELAAAKKSAADLKAKIKDRKAKESAAKKSPAKKK